MTNQPTHRAAIKAAVSGAISHHQASEEPSDIIRHQASRQPRQPTMPPIQRLSGSLRIGSAAVTACRGILEAAPAAAAGRSSQMLMSTLSSSQWRSQPHHPQQQLPHQQQSMQPEIARWMSESTAPAKKVKKVKSKKKPKGDTTRSRETDIILRSLDAPTTKEPPLKDPEEIQRREAVRKAYTIGRFEQHNELDHDLNCKIKLKTHALNMLPRPHSNAANDHDGDGKYADLLHHVHNYDEQDTQRDRPLKWRKMPKWTPPIPGFDPNMFDLDMDK